MTSRLYTYTHSVLSRWRTPSRLLRSRDQTSSRPRNGRLGNLPQGIERERDRQTSTHQSNNNSCPSSANIPTFKKMVNGLLLPLTARANTRIHLLDPGSPMGEKTMVDQAPNADFFIVEDRTAPNHLPEPTPVMLHPIGPPPMVKKGHVNLRGRRHLHPLFGTQLPSLHHLVVNSPGPSFTFL